MADIRKRLPYNVDGDFFVDSTCIDCDTCRLLAPATFGDLRDYSYVSVQPRNVLERRKAMRALLACPTGSIGTRHRNNAREIMNDFPIHLEAGVYYAGFNSQKSYGGHSYFLQHPAGNWLVDSPKYIPHLVRKFEALGGIKYIFLTHRDDVAEAHKYARKFGGQRIIHRAELSAQPAAEIIVKGQQPVPLFPDFLVVPTPGHTRGHCVLLYRDKFLFAGDHVWWNRGKNQLSASRSVCWYSWSQQTKSMVKLQDFTFEWVLPGHGHWVKYSSGRMRQELETLVGRMRATTI